MKDNTRSILIILLLLTLFIAGVSVFIGIQLQQRNLNPQDVAAACVTGKARCRTDNPGICAGLHPSDGNLAIDAMVGQLCGGGGAPNNTEYGDCTYLDACAPHVNPGTSSNPTQCAGSSYTDVATPFLRLSTGEPANGSFIGCNALAPAQNCFCTQDVAQRSGFTSGTVTCLPDSGSNSCGAKEIVVVTDTPTPTPTITNTNTPTPSITATVTNTPTVTLTGTPTVTPSASPSITVTATATNTPTPTPSITQTVTPTPSITIILTPVATVIPTLPPTALINDSTDRLIVATVLVIIGTGYYLARSRYHKQ